MAGELVGQQPERKPEGSSSDFGEVGASGLKRSGGYITEEFLPQLMGTKANQVFREMSDNEPVIGGIVLAFEQIAGKLDWHIEAPDDPTPEEKLATMFIESAMEDMEDSWDTVLSNIFSFLTFGWSYFEVNYKKRNGREGEFESRWSDGRIGWKNWAIRAQETLMRWEFGEHGTIEGMMQFDPVTGKSVVIPMYKGLLFRTSEFKNNPQGRSMLRNAYVPYYYLKRLREYEAIGVERDLAGLPKVILPSEWFNDSATPGQKAAVTQMKNLVVDIKRNKREGLLMPVAYDDRGNKMIDFELIASGGTKQHDTDKIITRYKQEIAQSLLADFITMGHDNVGSYNLGTAKMDMWVSVVDSLCKSIADVVNKHAIEKLLRVNGMQVNRSPKLVYGTVKNVDLTALGSYIGTLISGGLLTADPTLEGHLREMADLPPAEEPLVVGGAATPPGAVPPVQPGAQAMGPGTRPLGAPAGAEEQPTVRPGTVSTTGAVPAPRQSSTSPATPNLRPGRRVPKVAMLTKTVRMQMEDAE